MAYINKKIYTYTTQAAVRAAFWAVQCPNGKPKQFRGKSQNDLPADIRVSWVEFVDSLEKSGEISEKLARRVTL